MLKWLGDRRHGLSILIALVLVLVGGFAYFDGRVDTRIENGLDVLKRREAETFVNARTTLLLMWLKNEELAKEFQRTPTYTRRLLDLNAEAILNDDEYQRAFVDMSTYYSNAAACTLRGICDGPLMCGTLWSETQDFLDVTRGYFEHWKSVRYEDANTLILSIPEFESYCEEKLHLRVASHHDYTSLCGVRLYVYRLTGLDIGLPCKFETSEYVRRVECYLGQRKKNCPC